MRAFPTARTDGILIEQVGAEAVVYDTESAAAHCLKPIAAAVLARCDGRRSIEEISRLVSDDLSEPVGVDAVERALDELREHALLVAIKEPGPLQITVSRRQMLRRTAGVGGAAIAAPLIASIVAPSSAFAAASACHTHNADGSLVGCNSAADCGCPPGTPGRCQPSGSGTCLCKTFPGCATPAGYSGVCAYHLPDSQGGTCDPPCANGTPPCR